MAHSSKKSTPQEEAELLSALEGSALGDDYGHDAEFDPDLADLNDPDVQELGEAPMLGGQPHSSTMFGQDAMSAVGRATSPKLWASASQFPSAAQFRVWRMENGVPVGLGAIAVDATEEDFVRSFFAAMPESGDGRFQFILRPITVRGKELGKEIPVNISEHHSTLRHLRERRKREEADAAGQWGRGPGGDVIVNGGQGDGSAFFAEEMGRMFEHSVEMAEAQARQAREQLERERDELRQQEKQRAEERIRAAENASSVTERMTEKLLQTDRARSAEALSSQKETSQLVMSTITTTFQQQQEAARLQAERERQLEMRRQEQERAFHERREKEMEMQRLREREEAERRRIDERAEHERKLERERAELSARREQLKLEMEERRMADERRREQERQDWERRTVTEKQEREERERRERERFEREKLELERKAQAEKLEWEKRREDMRREDERRDRERREEAERKEQQRRHEIELQQKQLDLQAQKDREHAERMMEMSRQEREAQREAQLARERSEREAREATDGERQRRHELMLKEMEIQKDRDREHAERMLQLSKVEAGGGGGLSGIVDMLGMETPEVLSRIFGSAGEGGESSSWSDAIPKVMGGLGELAKVAMSARAPGTPDGAASKAGPVRHGRRQAKEQKMVAVQTADGVQLIPEDKVKALQQEQLRRMQQQGVRANVQHVEPGQIDLPDAPFRPPGMADGDKNEIIPKTRPQPQAKPAAEEAPKTEAESLAQSKLAAGAEVDTTKRAQGAGLKLKQQRDARKALRRLAGKLATSDESEWMGIVTGEITANIDVYHYLKAVTVYAALAEAKVDAELAERVVASLKDSGMVPPEVLPYDEEDFVRIEAAELMAELADDSPESASTELATAPDNTEGGA